MTPATHPQRYFKAVSMQTAAMGTCTHKQTVIPWLLGDEIRHIDGERKGNKEWHRKGQTGHLSSRCCFSLAPPPKNQV